MPEINTNIAIHNERATSIGATPSKLNVNITIRNEQAADIDMIAELTEAAFRNESHSTHTEQFIVNALRHYNQLMVSLVAVEEGTIVGHVAISPVTISSGAIGWYGLGPVSVSPDYQGQGIGSKLVKTALAELKGLGGFGCVVLGDPAYYSRFGFDAHSDLVLPDVPSEYFQALPFGSELPNGVVSYHEAFSATE